MNQKGLVHLVLITTTLLILAGIAIAVYLTQFTQIFKPKASIVQTTAQSTVPLKKDIQFWWNPNIYYGIPDGLGRINPVDYQTFWDDDDKLKEILPNISVFSYFGNAQFAPYMPQMSQVLRKYNLSAVNVSPGGASASGGPEGNICKNHQSGEYAAEIEIKSIKDNVTNLGIELGYITMDDPLSRTIAKGEYSPLCDYTDDEAIQEVIDFMKAFHRAFPNVKIGMQPNFANWKYAGTPAHWGPAPWWHDAMYDYKDVLDKFLDKVEDSGEKIEFIHVDNPYEATYPGPNSYPDIDYMKRLLDLEEQVHSYGIRFGVMFNSGADSDEKMFNDVMAYIDKYRARGGRPDDYVFKSWTSYPRKLLPFYEPHTYAYQVATALRRIDTAPTGAFDGVAACTTVVGWACDLDTPSKPLYIQLIADGKLLKTEQANQSGESVLAQACGGYSSKRFRFPLPDQLKDGANHELHIVAINTNSFGQNTELTTSPTIVQCAKPSSSPSPTPIIKVGDLNPPAGGDGNVDMADFNIFARYYKDKDLRADFNSNGRVDLADLNMLIRNFGL